MLAKIDNIEKVAQNTYTFWLKTQKPFKYTAGQFIEMHLPHENPDKRGQKHWFTLSSSPSEKMIAITTKNYYKKSSTFKQKLFSLKTGDEIQISESMGDFVLPKDPDLPLVFVAGGIGVTPMRSIVRWLIDTSGKRNIRMIYTARKQEDLAFLELFKTYNLDLRVILSRPTLKTENASGEVNGDIIYDFSHKNQDQLFFVSGPKQMTEKLETELLEIGIPSEKLVLDFFPGYGDS